MAAPKDEELYRLTFRRLATVDDVRAAMAKVARAMASRKLEPDVGRAVIYALRNVLQACHLRWREDFEEQKLAALASIPVEGLAIFQGVQIVGPAGPPTQPADGNGITIDAKALQRAQVTKAKPGSRQLVKIKGPKKGQK